MTLPGSTFDVSVTKNPTQHSITTDLAKKSEKKKEGSLIALIGMIVLALLAAVMAGGFLVTPFFPEGVYIGISALASLLISILLFPIFISRFSPSTLPTRPKDLDLSKLDTRYNRLLHEIIKEDEKKYEQEQKEKVQRKPRSLRCRPKQQTNESSSDETPKPRRKTSGILNLIRPKTSSSNMSSSLSSHDSDSSATESPPQPKVMISSSLPTRHR
ncbi:hypothetical protein [Chlamydia felis Fe/C-56]|uniref:Uncharacterized protein n=1 Tax=Chlamydia felis (strain Fe/C-56) TaxID=264202 RepID=Q253T1_CHLFF|nr:IncA family protein [Chlamydia felis]BAE81457.1 hypothetical protein [Chlamydia felis Fe/C-56]